MVCFCLQTIVRGTSQTGLQNGMAPTETQRINVARSNSLRQQSPQPYRGNNYAPSGVPPTVREYEPQGPPRAQPPQGYGGYPAYGQQGPSPEFYNSMTREKPPGADYRDYRDIRDPRDNRHPREVDDRQYLPGLPGYPEEYPTKDGPPDYRDGRMRDNGSLQRPREREMRPQQMPRSPSATIPPGGHYQNYNPAVVNGGVMGAPPAASLQRKQDYDDHGGFRPQAPGAVQQYDRVSIQWRRQHRCQHS